MSIRLFNIIQGLQKCFFLIVILFLLSAYLHSKDLIREGNKGDVSYEPDDQDIEYNITLNFNLFQCLRKKLHI